MLLADVLWRRRDQPSLEHCRLSRLDAEQGSFYWLTGTVIALEAGSPYRVMYSVHCDDRWRTRGVHVTTIHGNDHRQLQLESDGAGNWLRGGEPANEFAGLLDVDLSITPATNTLPIRRLGLEVGQEAAVEAAWIRFPALELTPLPQRYRRTGHGSYQYESRGGEFTASLDVDHEGMVVRYGELWERVSS